MVGVLDLTARGVRRCERYDVVPLARMVQQKQYHPSLPAEERGSPTAQPPGKGRNFSRTGRKRLRQEVRAKPGRRPRRPKTARQSQDPGTPVSASDKAELTTRHLAVQQGLEPGPAAALTVSRQDLFRAEQGAGISARPWYGSIGPSPATALCGATPVPAVKRHRQQGSGRGCRCNKHLGKCEHQIAPHETRYQLHNVDRRTLLHCNCTRRCESRRKRALCAYSWGSEEVGCLPWPAPANVYPAMPAGWQSASIGQGTAVTWTGLCWLTTLPWTALFWSCLLPAAQAGGHSTAAVPW